MAFSSLTPVYRFGLVLMLLACLALGTVAWQGLRNHRDLVWSEAREEAVAVADRFERELVQKTRTVRFYDFPPKPGTFDFQAQAPIEDLRQQMNLDERTSSGLPVAVLAAFEIAKRTGGVRDGEQAYRLALTRWPDLTSPKILAQLAELATQHGWEGEFANWEPEWDRDELARDLIREVEQFGWSSRGNELARIEKLGKGEFSYLAVSNDTINWREGRIHGLGLESKGVRLGQPGESVLRRSLGGATLLIGVLDPEALEAEWRSRRNGTLLTLGLASIIIGSGMWMMTRGLIKEKEASQARNQFVASVTHELRAPVGAMRLISDTLREGKLSEDKVSEFHHLLSRESGRLSVLIENVMDLARVEEGKRFIQKQALDFAEVAREVCEMMDLEAKERGLTLQHTGSSLQVEADPLVLRQILVNLIDNAIKFSPGGGTITLSWDNGWSFTVSDQGPGIPPEERSRIFERFYRGGDELRRETKGVGIGLSLVKELAELHGGSVEVSNQGGAVFKVSFPVS